jgi:hypothetical protein
LEKTNNWNIARKFEVLGTNICRWRQQNIYKCEVYLKNILLDPGIVIAGIGTRHC